MKKFYETPDMEEIRFASLDAIALSDTEEYDPENTVGDEDFVGGDGFGF